jgi:hypothetical protein
VKRSFRNSSQSRTAGFSCQSKIKIQKSKIQYHPAMRWIIGDIHGMLRPLDALLALVHKEDPDPVFLFVGDYINRGPDSRGVIDRLLTLPSARFIRGNHDDVFDLILHGHAYAAHGSVRDPIVAFQWFMDHGLDQTLLSYGVDEEELEKTNRRPSRQRLRKILEAVPQSHRDFIRNLSSGIEYDDLFILHAFWAVDEPTESPRPTQRLEDHPPTRQTAVWGRYTEKEIHVDKPWNRTGYFGHTAVNNYTPALLTGQNLPIRGPQIVLLDTGVALSTSGRLTAFCPDTQRYLQVDHFAEAVPESQC